MTIIPRIFQILAVGLPLAAAASAQTGFPFGNETLRYSVNWPSGLNLGEATFSASRTDAGWKFDVALNAAVPGFAVADKVGSAADANLCSTQLVRDLSQGRVKSSETTTFDQKRGSAHRVTTFPLGGGKSDFDIPTCPRDALAFLYYARRELGQGRVPPQQQIYYGGAYSVRLEYAGAETIKTEDKSAITDRVTVSVKGPKSDFRFDIFFARDAARTPLSVRAPLAAGTLTMDLVR